MIYTQLNPAKITLGASKNVFGSKQLTPIYYNEASLEFSEKNRYIIINGIETNQYDKKQINVKSKYIIDNITSVIESIQSLSNITIKSPINSSGYLRINITKDTRFVDRNNKTINPDTLSTNKFHACISVLVPTYFSDGAKHTLQINVGECIVVEVVPSLEVDFAQLKVSE